MIRQSIYVVLNKIENLFYYYYYLLLLSLLFMTVEGIEHVE